MFSGRSIAADKSNRLAKMVSMQHLASICAKGFRRARADLEAGRTPEGNTGKEKGDTAIFFFV